MRKQLLGVIALLFIVASAFTFARKENSAQRITYFYVLDSSGDPYDEGDYEDRLDEAPEPCGGDSEVCWVEAEDNGVGGPEIDAALEQEIDDALAFHEDQDHVKLRN